MQRWLSTLLGLCAFGLAVAVVVRTMSDKPAPAKIETKADAAPAVESPKDAGAKKPVADAEDPFAGLAPEPMQPGAVGRFPDGRPVPPLPDGSPKHVKLGVVLMSYAGAEGASPKSRAKKEALEL